MAHGPGRGARLYHCGWIASVVIPESASSARPEIYQGSGGGGKGPPDWDHVVWPADAALTWLAMGSSIITASAIRQDTILIFLMGGDPSKVGGNHTHEPWQGWVVRKKVQESEQENLWNL